MVFVTSSYRLDLISISVAWEVFESPLSPPPLLSPVAPIDEVVPLTVLDPKLALLSMNITGKVRVSK
ncbi:hypothetical protein D3C72_1555550 [compost metagenome]